MLKQAGLDSLSLMGIFGLFTACHTTTIGKRTNTGSNVSSFIINEFKPAAGDPDWWKLIASLNRADGDKKVYERTFLHDQFRGSASVDLVFTIPYGKYTVTLNYTDAKNASLYRVCPSTPVKIYDVNSPLFQATLAICKLDSTTPVGQVTLSSVSDVTLNPKGMINAACPDVPTALGFDNIYGACIDRSKSYYVDGGEIFQRGTKIVLKGINWFGMDGGYSDQAHPPTSPVELRLGGLWRAQDHGLSGPAQMEAYIKTMKALGFNAWRLPISPDVLNPATPGFDGYDTALHELQDFLRITQAYGMHVLLDMHNCKKDGYYLDMPGPGTPNSACANFTEAVWIDALKALATVALPYSNVVGIDLFSEPRAFTWDVWSDMADRAGKAVLGVNPGVLVFVEGVGSASPSDGKALFWGENLTEAATKVPKTLPRSRLVYSPHVYGPSVSSASDFADAAFPGNMPAIWDAHFGSLKDAGFAVAVGEFGGLYKAAANDADHLWQARFVQYIQEKKFKHFFYWAMNQNAGDTGGLYTDDAWTQLDMDKLGLLQPLLQQAP